jgi:MoxR-like ATPase
MVTANKANKANEGDHRAAVRKLRMQLRSALVGRTEVADGVMMGLLAGESVLMLGEPGTAKSCLARLAAEAITDARRFFVQLHPAMPPEDLFGPYDLKRMKSTGEWARRWQRFLPAANAAVIDEVFRGSGAILDTMLKAINEHRYEDDGGEIDVPLELLVGTTNSVPDEPHLQAMYDRWVLRYYVKPPQTSNDMTAILSMTAEPSVDATVTMEQVHRARADVRQVPVPKAVIDAFTRVWSELRAQGLQLSARKARKVLGLMQARAWMSGRDEVDTSDLDVIADVAWSDPEQYPAVRRIVLQSVSPASAEAVEALDNAVRAVDSVPAFDGGNESAVAAAGAKARKQIARYVEDAKSLRASAEPHEHDRLDAVIGDLTEQLNKVLRKMTEIARAM